MTMRIAGWRWLAASLAATTMLAAAPASAAANHPPVMCVDVVGASQHVVDRLCVRLVDEPSRELGVMHIPTTGAGVDDEPIWQFHGAGVYTQVQVHVTNDLAAIPVNPSGHPMPTRFDHGFGPDGGISPVTVELDHTLPVHVAVRAEIVFADGTTRTAWAGDIRFDRNDGSNTDTPDRGHWPTHFTIHP